MEGCPKWEGFLMTFLDSPGGAREAQVFLGRALCPSRISHQAALDKPVVDAG